MVFFSPKSPYEGMCTCPQHAPIVNSQVKGFTEQKIAPPHSPEPVEYSQLLENTVKSTSFGFESIFTLFFSIFSRKKN